jgi:formylglycine-generating enzyme
MHRLFTVTLLTIVLGSPLPLQAAESPSLPDGKIATGKDGAPMVLIPAGPFPMGVPTGDRDGGRDEYPRHDVQLDDYYIDKYEVTNGRYLEFVKAANHRVPQNPRNPTRNLWEGPAISESLTDRPVVNVDWADANAYCTWAGKRLPTEAEWEKAAKGNNDWRFPWGNVEPTAKHLNYNQKWIGEKTLMPVGSYEAGKSPYGVYDMAGNVWEWTRDWFTPRFDPAQPAVRVPRKVVKGGSFLCADSYCARYRPAARRPQMIDTGMSHIGFRCVVP